MSSEKQTPEEAMKEDMRREVSEFLTEINTDVDFVDSSAHFERIVESAKEFKGS